MISRKMSRFIKRHAVVCLVGTVLFLLAAGSAAAVLEARPKASSAALSSTSARLRTRLYAPSPRRSSALHPRLWAAFSKLDRPRGFSAGPLKHATPRPGDPARSKPAADSFIECAKCHGSLDDFDNPKIAFRHRSHPPKYPKTGAGCRSCHDAGAHSPEQRIIRPTGRACEKCHNHNPTSAPALYRCDLCHRPAFLAASSLAGRGDYRHRGAARADSPPGVEIDLSLPVTAEKCRGCHVLGHSSASVRFKHSTHFRRGIQCLGCHYEKPHEPGVVRRPKMEACSVCHGLTHGNQGKVAPKQCDFCHRPGWRQKPADHTDRWLVDHKQGYEKGVNCLACHEKSACESCHGLEPIPHPAGWRQTHKTNSAGLFRKVCLKCHERNRFRLCESCHHPGYRPDSGEWVSREPGKSVHPLFLKVRGTEYCLRCHSPSFCPRCHVNQARGL